MKNQTLLKQSLGIATLFFLALVGTADLSINLPLVGVGVGFLASGLILALAAVQPRKSSL